MDWIWVKIKSGLVAFALFFGVLSSLSASECSEKGDSGHTETGQPLIFLPGLKETFRATPPNTFKDAPSVVSVPDGLILGEGGFMEWTPPVTIAAGTYQIKLAGRGNEKNLSEAIELTVLPSTIVKGQVEGRYFRVTDRASGLYGFVFEFEDEVSANNVFFEISNSCIPKREYFHKAVSAGFYTLSDVEFDLYIPVFKMLFSLWFPYSIFNANSHYWINYSLATDGVEIKSRWSNYTGWREQTKLNGKRYLKYERMNANALIVIGLSQRDHNAR